MANAGWPEAPIVNYVPQPQIMCLPPQPIAFQQQPYMAMPQQPYVVSMQPSYISAPTSTIVRSTKPTGSVKKWFNKKGFGFITKSDGSDVFVHHSSIKAQGRASLEIGESVEFNIYISDDGREKAMDVTGPGGTYVKGSSVPYSANEGYNGKRQVCFNFQNKGTCKYGTNCRFSHGDPGGGYYADGFKRGGYNGGRKSSFNNQKMGSYKLDDSSRFPRE